jgi:hypothetical protein
MIPPPDGQLRPGRRRQRRRRVRHSTPTLRDVNSIASCPTSVQRCNALPNLLIVARTLSYTASQRNNLTRPFTLPLPVLWWMTTSGSL